MKTLEKKIFQVLTSKISVSGFETWLYSCDEILNNLDNNSFYFDVISVNYKTMDCIKTLNNLIVDTFGNKTLKIIDIYNCCAAIMKSENEDDIYSELLNTTRNFNFDTDYSILWELYYLRDHFDLAKDGYGKIETVISQAKFYAKNTLEIFEENSTFEDLNTALFEDIEPFKKVVQKKNYSNSKSAKIESKSTVIEKIFAFFKKI